METNFKMYVILTVYSENAAQVVITTWGWHNRTCIACYISSKLFKFKECNAKYFTCKKKLHIILIWSLSIELHTNYLLLFNKCVIQHFEIYSLASYEISHDSQETMVFEYHSSYR